MPVVRFHVPIVTINFVATLEAMAAVCISWVRELSMNSSPTMNSATHHALCHTPRKAMDQIACSEYTTKAHGEIDGFVPTDLGPDSAYNHPDEPDLMTVDTRANDGDGYDANYDALAHEHGDDAQVEKVEMIPSPTGVCDEATARCSSLSISQVPIATKSDWCLR
jgi:hypothetical protein